MSNSTPKYTTLRNKIYWLHYKLPTAIFRQSNLKSQLVRFSLNTRDPDKAGYLSQILIFKLQEHCKLHSPTSISKASIDKTITSTLESFGEVPCRSVEQLKPKVSELNISSAFELYCQEMTSSEMWRVKTQCDNQGAVRRFIELMGDVALSAVSAALCREYKSKLMRYPLLTVGAASCKNRSIKELIDSGEIYPTISTTTINNQIRKLNSFFNWLVKQDFIRTNPISGMKIRQKGSLKAARTSFSQSDLAALFSSPLYTEHKFRHDYQYWLPLLALYSGARIEEICQLHIADITIESPYPHYKIDDSFKGQHIKNSNSRRTIPIHPELLELGFARLIAEKKQQGEIKLFGYLVPQREQLSHKPSQWFSKYKRGLGITDSRKVFHSFRHTMVDSLKQVRAHDYEIKALLGHQNGSVTHDIYGAIETPINLISDMVAVLSFKTALASVKPWN
jgi:integrase